MRESSLDCIIMMDHQGKITEFNPAAERTFGYARADVVGRLLSEVIVPPALRESHAAGLRQYLVSGSGPVIGKRLEVPAIRADGTEIPVELAINVVQIDGPPVFVAYLRDITQLKKAQAEAKYAEKLALVASRTDNAVIISDVDGNIEWVNEGFIRITGYTLAEVVGRKPGAFLQGPETDPATVLDMCEKLRKGEGFQTEIVNYAKDGRKYWLAASVQPIHDAAGKLTNFIAIESDITERKRAERHCSKPRKSTAAFLRTQSTEFSKLRSRASSSAATRRWPAFMGMTLQKNFARRSPTSAASFMSTPCGGRTSFV